MQTTDHIDARMNQRGIRKSLVDLTVDIGEIHGDRRVLTLKLIDDEFVRTQRRKKALTLARKKGGVVVVIDCRSVLASYCGNSFNPEPANMNQRVIPKDLMDIAVDLGEIDGDRRILTLKLIDAELVRTQRTHKALTDARKKGGVVVVADGDSLITAYRGNSYNPKLAKKSQR